MMNIENKSLIYNRCNGEHVQVMGYLYARHDLYEKILQALPDEMCYLMGGEYHDLDGIGCILRGDILVFGGKRYRFHISDLLDTQSFKIFPLS